MHVIPPHQTTVTLFERDGSASLFKTRKDALRALGIQFIRWKVGASFDVPAPGGGRNIRLTAYGFPFVPPCDYVLIDDAGNALDARAFEDLLPARRPCRWGRPFGEYGVKHPGRKRSAYYHCFRRPRTTAERRQNCLVIHEEGEPPIRGCRSATMLPTVWDDKYRKPERGWKAQRKTQHRAGGERRAHPRNGGGQ